jgi:hypothetical protein
MGKATTRENRASAVLARTEQGLWATVFVNLYEDRSDLAPEAFREAAAAIGFGFLDRLVACYGCADVSTFGSHAAFVRSLVAGIDSESPAK